MRYFPPFRFDESDLALWQGSVRVQLTQKAAALLHCLLDHAGEWVGKDSILERVWPDTHVHPDNIKVLVCELRHALGDDARSPVFIRTQPGRGYKFVATVSESAPDEPPVEPEVVATFIARRQELSALTDAFDAALSGQARVVLVSGERGVGKSTLCQVFLRTVQAVCPIRHAIGLCAGRRTPAEPFEPLPDALRRLSADGPARVRDLMSRYAPGWCGRIPELSAAGTAQPVEPGAMIDELGTLLTRLAADAPLVLVLEDLQWADLSTFDALSALAERGDRARFLILGTGTGLMPSPGERAGAWARRVPGIPTVAVPPLTESQVATYVNARFGPTALSDHVPALCELTSGNPSLIVESLERLIARGLVRQAGGAWQVPSRDGLEAALSRSVAESLARRLDTVDEEDRSVLELAALVGSEFTADLVAEAGGYDARAVSRRLLHLVREGHITPTGLARALRYQFRFPQLKDVLRQRSPALRQMRVTPIREQAG